MASSRSGFSTVHFELFKEIPEAAKKMLKAGYLTEEFLMLGFFIGS